MELNTERKSVSNDLRLQWRFIFYHYNQIKACSCSRMAQRSPDLNDIKNLILEMFFIHPDLNILQERRGKYSLD